MPSEGERQRHVLPDPPVGATADVAGGQHEGEVVANDDDVRGLGGDVGATAQRHAHVGAHQGRGIVDAIAHHGHPMSGALEPADEPGLAFGQNLGVHLFDTQLGGDAPGGTRGCRR